MTDRPELRAALALGLMLAACAPPEADFAISERARTAPTPRLAPTASFEAPLAGGTEAAVRLRADTEALAARAEALRGRGVELSGAPVVGDEDRARLEAAAADAPAR